MTIEPIPLTKERIGKLLEMCKALIPEYVNSKMGKNWDRDEVWFDNYPHQEPKPTEVHWFELCFTTLAAKVAEIHGQQPGTTPNWSHYMILQKMAHDHNKENPIDFLYDVWKRPSHYIQNL
jgi:hypothetical protein